MGNLVVSKFGGTSMGDAQCMLRSAEVALKQGSSLVVVSATSGTTNDLISLGKTAEKQTSWAEIEAILTKIVDKHRKIASDLVVSKEAQMTLNVLFEEMQSLAKGVHLLKDCSMKAMDTLVSLGERMSSVLFTEAMEAVLKNNGLQKRARLFDVRTVLRTDDQCGKARPLRDEVARLCAKNLSPLMEKEVVVTQGFIGMTEDGITTTLGRGGSDYSAAILAEGVQAQTLEIWTDVAGIATTDPRLCPKAQPIKEISFKEASELATFGAKVLHPATLLPAIRKNIPVFVGSSFDREAKGTWIRKDVEEHPLIRAMAIRKKQVLVTLSTPEMLHAHGFLYQVFKIFNDHKVSIDAITTSEISVSVTLDDSTLLNKKLIADLSQIAEVQVEDNLSLISLIGNNINHTSGLGKKIFDQIPDINVRMICLGASKHNFCFLVNEEQGVDAVQRLHKYFVEAGVEELA